MVLQIYNDEGVLVEEVDDLDFADKALDQIPYIYMYDIYTNARRVVMGVNKAIDMLLDALE